MPLGLREERWTVAPTALLRVVDPTVERAAQRLLCPRFPTGATARHTRLCATPIDRRLRGNGFGGIPDIASPFDTIRNNTRPERRLSLSGGAFTPGLHLRSARATHGRSGALTAILRCFEPALERAPWMQTPSIWRAWLYSRR